MKQIARERRGGATTAVLYVVVAAGALILVFSKGAMLGLPDYSWMAVGGAALLGLPLTLRRGRSKSKAKPLPSGGRKGAPRTKNSGAPAGLAAKTPTGQPAPRPTPGGNATAAKPASQPRQSGAQSRAILVLPLTIGGTDPSIDALAEGVAEAVLLGLAGLQGARVPARDSAFSFKFRDVSAAAAGEEIGAGFVLEGRIGTEGEKLTLAARLVRVSNGQPAWSGKLEGTLDTVSEMEDALIRAVAKVAGLPIPPNASPLSPGRRTRSGEAQRAYLQGRYDWHRGGEGYQRAAPGFEQAVRADERFALALAGRAENQVLQGFYGYVEPRSSFQRARESAEAALGLDDALPEAWSALGCARMFRDWEWRGAEEAFRRGVGINPAVVTARFWAGMNRGLSGHLVDWIRHCVTALRQDPRSVLAHLHVGWALLGARMYRKAHEVMDQAVELNPNFGFAYWLRGRARAYGGDVDGGLVDLIESAKRTKVNPIAVASLGYLVGKSGNTKRAERHLHDMASGPAGWRWILPTQLATIELGLGRQEEALKGLQHALEVQDIWLPLTLRRPEWDPLRREAAFQAVLKGVGLAEVPRAQYEQARAAMGVKTPQGG
jgi:TolB-like protein